MKQAQEFRVGNVVKIGNDALIILRTEFNRGGRNAATVRLKMKNILSGGNSEQVFKADDKLDQIVLDRKEVTYSYYAEPSYVFMDEEYNQYEVDKESMGDALNYLDDGMQFEMVFYEGRPLSVEMPSYVVREIEYTEPAVRGDTSGKVLKPARIKPTGYEIQVPAFCEIGDKIEIDTATAEYRNRVKG